jgi:hypothetical protein
MGWGWGLGSGEGCGGLAGRRRRPAWRKARGRRTSQARIAAAPRCGAGPRRRPSLSRARAWVRPISWVGEGGRPARQVSPKTIRDIWNRRTWAHATAHLPPLPAPTSGDFRTAWAAAVGAASGRPSTAAGGSAAAASTGGHGCADEVLLQPTLAHALPRLAHRPPRVLASASDASFCGGQAVGRSAGRATAYQVHIWVVRVNGCPHIAWVEVRSW